MKLLLSLLLCATAAFAQAPSTVIHIINIKWKVDATPEQIKAVVDAVQQLPTRYPGIKRVWIKPLRYQGQEGFRQAIVMEFESQDALKKYENSPAQKWWYEQYLPIRDDSRTDDITN
jgi:antibiotic biosynthesis monooxygenase (ABM) superfamily enzyme